MFKSELDQELIGRLQRRDKDAADQLARIYGPMIHQLAFRYMKSWEDAEEVAQDVMLELWRRRETLAVEESLRAYLFQAARNRALNHQKREQRASRWSAATAAGMDETDPSAPDESALLDALELQDAIEHLPARCRLIFTLSRRQDMSYGEIASSLGLSIKTVETQMGRALEALRERLRHLVAG